jgi:transcriptional regulator with XRE-family HTH domain
MKHTLPEKVRIIRLVRGYTEAYMASKLHISQQAYSYLEREQKNIPEEKLILIAQILAVTIEFILEFNPELLLGNL